jgi:hypothetical protein
MHQFAQSQGIGRQIIVWNIRTIPDMGEAEIAQEGTISRRSSLQIASYRHEQLLFRNERPRMCNRSLSGGGRRARIDPSPQDRDVCCWKLRSSLPLISP